MHTKDKLAEALAAAGLNGMAEKARAGWYHDFESPLPMPCQQLAMDLSMYANGPAWPRRDEARDLLDRHMKGEFDASQEESEAWAQSQEGREAFNALMYARPGTSRPGKQPGNPNGKRRR